MNAVTIPHHGGPDMQFGHIPLVPTNSLSVVNRFAVVIYHVEYAIRHRIEEMLNLHHVDSTECLFDRTFQLVDAVVLPAATVTSLAIMPHTFSCRFRSGERDGQLRINFMFRLSRQRSTHPAVCIGALSC